MRLRTNWEAICLTSRGHVAEKNSVCRFGGMARTIFWIWGSKPMSSMRSASSSTRYDTCSTFVQSRVTWTGFRDSAQTDSAERRRHDW